MGRSFFTPPDGRSGHPLGGGREAWTGYYQSVRPSMGWTITLNLDGKKYMKIDIKFEQYHKHECVLAYICMYSFFNYM